ncbi:hypothetical protein LCGC14_2304450 [marine sediment metagenome]|uniref:Uncharacterized protein n=1 Tax=marine sediment metagenome TaxID=412755 RepID=A0A0F9D9Y6_9ZZZZ
MTNEKKKQRVQTELAGLDAEARLDDENGIIIIWSQGEALARVFCNPVEGTFEECASSAVKMIRDLDLAPKKIQ